MSDKITGMAVICEYTLRPVDICNFCRPGFFARFAVIINDFFII